MGSRGSHDRNRPGAPGRLVSAGFAREPPPPALTVLANDMTEDAPDARPRLRRRPPSIPDDTDAPPTDAASSPADASTSSLQPPPLSSAADKSPTDSRRDGGAEPYGLVPAEASPRSASDPALPRLLSRLSVFLPTMEAIRSSVNGDFRPVGEWVMLPTGEGSFCGSRGSGGGSGWNGQLNAGEIGRFERAAGFPSRRSSGCRTLLGAAGAQFLRSTRRYS